VNCQDVTKDILQQVMISIIKYVFAHFHQSSSRF